MQFALDDRARKIVDAEDIVEATRYRAYSCPKCDARVHYRRSMALSPDPGFAHNPHEGKPDCDDYYPGTGNYIPSPSPAARPSVSRTVEDRPEEFGLCLDEAEPWSVYLRVPELTKAEAESTTLRSLAEGFLEVTGAKRSLPLIELRPGVGTARLRVAPTTLPYKVTPVGAWPRGIAQRRWQNVTSGLNLKGTLFRFRHGEWVRLREGSALELGEEIRLVAEHRNAPPSECHPEGSAAQPSGGQVWRMWRLTLPFDSTASLERWSGSLGMVLVEAAWDVSVASIPIGFDFATYVPVFPSGQTLYARLRPPYEGARAEVSLTTGSARFSERIVTPEEGLESFLAFRVPWPGTNEVRVSYDDRNAAGFETVEPPSISDLREAVAGIPRLRISVGEKTAEAWHKPLELSLLSKNQENQEISIFPELDDLRLNISWESSDGGGVEEALSVDAMKRRLAKLLALRRRVSARIDGGALGVIQFCVSAVRRTPETAKPAASRTAPWLRIASLQRVDDRRFPASAWMLRRAAALNRGLLNATQVRGVSPQFVRVIREAGEN